MSSKSKKKELCKQAKVTYNDEWRCLNSKIYHLESQNAFTQVSALNVGKQEWFRFTFTQLKYPFSLINLVVCISLLRDYIAKRDVYARKLKLFAIIKMLFPLLHMMLKQYS